MACCKELQGAGFSRDNALFLISVVPSASVSLSALPYPVHQTLFKPPSSRVPLLRKVSFQALSHHLSYKHSPFVIRIKR